MKASAAVTPCGAMTCVLRKCAIPKKTTEISETLSLNHFPGLGLDLGLENTHFPGLDLSLSLEYS